MAYLWTHASHASGGIHSHWTAHVWMSCDKTQSVGMAAPLGSITNPYRRKKEDSHLEANIKFLCKTGRQYLEVGWGPGCLEGEVVTRGCSREADLAYGGRALGHLGTVET